MTRESLISRYWLFIGLLLIVVGLLLRASVPVAFGAVVLLAGAGSQYWSRLALERLIYQRRLEHRRAFVGETVEVAFSLVNRKPLPVSWIEVRDVVPELAPPEDARTTPSPAPQSLYLIRSTSLAWYERVTWRYRLRCKARGFYQLGPAQLRSGDIFGFFPVSRDEESIDRLTVLPRLLDLRDIGLPSLRPFGEARNGSRIFEDQSRIVGVRDYRPGDPLKRIDWKATARRQGLQSRLYDPSSTLNLLVALNVSTMERVWEGYDPLVLERAISVAASVARFAEEHRYTIGLAANCTFPNADRHIYVAPSRAPEQLTRVLESLAMVTPFTLVPMEDVLRDARRRLPAGATIVVVTGFLSEGMEAYLARHGGEVGRLALVWVGDQPPPSLAPEIWIHDAGPYLRELEQGWQTEHRSSEPVGVWREE